MHAETRGKAILRAMRNVNDSEAYTDFRARRLPGLDGKPITYQNAKAAGFEYWDGDNSETLLSEDEFINDCDCEICKQDI